MSRLAVMLVAAAMLIASCGGDSQPDSFDDDPGTIASALLPALAPGQDPAAVPATHRDFLEGCVMGGGKSIPELATVQQQGLLVVCGCSYSELVSKFRAEAAIDGEPGDTAEDLEQAAVRRFLDIDEAVRDGGELPADVVALVATCIQTTAF
jgi:hypothetical protein